MEDPKGFAPDSAERPLGGACRAFAPEQTACSAITPRALAVGDDEELPTGLDVRWRIVAEVEDRMQGHALGAMLRKNREEGQEGRVRGSVQVFMWLRSAMMRALEPSALLTTKDLRR